MPEDSSASATSSSSEPLMLQWKAFQLDLRSQRALSGRPTLAAGVGVVGGLPAHGRDGGGAIVQRGDPAPAERHGGRGEGRTHRPHVASGGREGGRALVGGAVERMC